MATLPKINIVSKLKDNPETEQVKKDYESFKNDTTDNGQIDTLKEIQTAIADLQKIATGSDGDIAKKEDIPTKTSELTNDSGFITEEALKDYAKTSDINIPTKTSELTNDSNYITSESLNGYAKTSDINMPTKTSELTNDSNFITSTELDSQLSEYAKKSDIGSGSGSSSGGTEFTGLTDSEVDEIFEEVYTSE